MTRLTASSVVVLGLLDRHGPSTPYGLERTVAASIGYFWTFPRSQLYAEAGRLARTGLVTETREQHGRRRRLLAVTDAGRDALAGWLTTRATEPTRIHDDALLRLYFARPGTGDPTVLTLAADQERAHRERLALYDGLVASGRLPEGSPQRATLELGRRFEEAAVRFWAEVPAAVGATGPA